MTEHQRSIWCRVLIVEDDYFISEELSGQLTGWGAIVVGPIPTQKKALEQVARDEFDVAVIEIKLGDKLDYLLADELMHRAIPFAIVTGYPAYMVPARFAGVPLLEKPCDERLLGGVMDRLFTAHNTALPCGSPRSIPLVSQFEPPYHEGTFSAHRIVT